MAIINFTVSPSNVGIELFSVVVPHDFLNTEPSPVHVVRIPHDHDDEEEAGGTNPPHVVLFVHNWELPAPPIRSEDALFTAHVQEASYPLPPQDGAAESFVGQSSTVVVTEVPAAQTLSTFLVKVTDVSVSGILTLNVLVSTYIWIWRQAAAPAGENTDNSFLKIFVILATIVMYQLTALVSSMAKADEHDRSYLGVISGFALAFIIWPVFLGGLMTKWMSTAAIWKIVLVATAVILIILAIWTRAFEHPRILRRIFCCFGRDRAAAQAPNDANARALQAAAADAHDEKV